MSNLGLQSFVDVDMGGDLDGIKSTTGYVFTLDDTVVVIFRFFKNN